jgi:hypothetical protein
MEEIAEACIISSSYSRFDILPLWNWVLAECTFRSKLGDFSGIACSSEKLLAIEMAKSEAIERLVYGVWDATNISPFTGSEKKAPISSSGFCAHSDEKSSLLNAFFEFHERVSLAAIADGEFTLKETTLPYFGFLFNYALIKIECRLSAYKSETYPFFTFVLGEIQGNAAIFGSASAETPTVSLQRSVVECLRKLAFYENWKKNKSSDDPFQSAANFWLSSRGLDAAKSFCRKGLRGSTLRGSTSIDRTPKTLDERLISRLYIHNRYVTYYDDKTFILAAPFGFEIPLL